MMNLKNAASVAMLATAIIFGGAGAIAIAQDEPEKPASQPVQAAAEPGVLEARLSDGATVRLKAVGDATGWWRPDGGESVTRTGTMLEGQLRMDQHNLELVERSGNREAAKAYAEAVRMGFVIEFGTPREYLGEVEVKNGSSYRIAREQQSFESDGTLLQFAPGQERVIEVVMPVGEPIARADVQLYSLDTQRAKLDGTPVGFTPLAQTPGLGYRGAEVTTVTVIYPGDLSAHTIDTHIVIHDPECERCAPGNTRHDPHRVVKGKLYTRHKIGNVHMLIFTFGPEQIKHPEDGRLHLALMPLEFVRFSNFATATDQKTTPKVEVLSNEQYVAMLREQAVNSDCPVPANGGDTDPAAQSDN